MWVARLSLGASLTPRGPSPQMPSTPVAALTRSWGWSTSIKSWWMASQPRKSDRTDCRRSPAASSCRQDPAQHPRATDWSLPRALRSPQDTSLGCSDPTMLRLTGFSGPLCAITQSEHLMSVLLILISELQGEEKCACNMDLFGLVRMREWGCDTQHYLFFSVSSEWNSNVSSNFRVTTLQGLKKKFHRNNVHL